MVAYVAVYYAMIINQVRVKTKLAREASKLKK